MKSRRGALCQGIETHVRDLLVREGIPATTARRVASGVVRLLTTEWGGQVISFPRGQVHTAHQRWVQIAAQFDGGNYAALAATHGYTERHIRKIVTRMKNEKKGEET